jgi:hypothetical protein
MPALANGWPAVDTTIRFFIAGERFIRIESYQQTQSVELSRLFVPAVLLFAAESIIVDGVPGSICRFISLSE